MTSTAKRVYVRLQRLNPIHLVILGYCSYGLIAWFLLSLPFTWTDGQRGTALDALFMATSAVSTTGLITVNTPLALSFWGELVVLISIQISGLGYMTLGSFVILAGTQKLSQARKGVITAAFALPEGFQPRRFIRNVVIFSFIVEIIGAALLFPAFANADVAARAATGEIGASFSGSLHVAWQSIFHSVSSFCTAGFSLYPDSLESYAADFWINAIVSALSILGAVGFIVMTDAYRAATSVNYRITLTSKIILLITAWFILGGAIVLFLGDPSLADMPAEQRLLVSFFQSMTAATTVGFNTYPLAELGLASVLLMYILMIIGASPSGTGGGLKSTSISALIATVRSVLKGRSQITFFGKAIPQNRLHAAFASLALYVSTLAVGGYLLLETESRRPAPSLGDRHWPFEDLLFEAASALGTVGLSRGVTPDLTELGKLIIIALMFVGRIGPLTLGLAFFTRQAEQPPEVCENEDLAV